MKKIIITLFIFCLAIQFSYAKGRSDKDNASGAKVKEPTGKIVIYTSIYNDVVDNLQITLKKQFPKCAIEFFYGGTGTIQARIAEEQASGRLGCDILMVAEPSYSLELKEDNMLHPFKSREASSLAFEYDPDGYWYPVRISNMVLAYNPEKFNKNSIPNSMYDFAYNSSVKGAVSMSNPLTSGTSMATVTALKDKYGYEYFNALGGQNVVIESGAVALEKLETGECKVAMILEESILKIREEEKSKLEVIYPTDGAVVIPSTIMIVNNQWNANRNTAAAEVIADWLLSPEGQTAIVSGWMHSVRKNFSKLPYDSIPTDQILTNSIPVDWENCFRQREEIRLKFEEYVTARE